MALVSGSHQDINAITILPAHNKEAGIHLYISHPIAAARATANPHWAYGKNRISASPNAYARWKAMRPNMQIPRGKPRPTLAVLDTISMAIR